MIEQLEILNKRFEKAVNKLFNFEALIFRSEELIDQNEFEQARGILLSILTIDNSQQDALNNLGVIELLSNNHEAAAGYFKKLLEAEPDNEIAKQNFEFLAKLSIRPEIQLLNIAALNIEITELNNAVYRNEGFVSFLTKVDKLEETFMPGLTEYFSSPDDAVLFLSKVSNLLVSKYQYLRRHKFLLGKPFGLLLDPANGCNLHCPGCVHTINDSRVFHWDKGILSEELFAKYLNYYGPYATHMLFYNYGEPLINKATPRYIAMAKEYNLYTSVSTNFSLPIDADAIVQSGLDYLLLSIDGATDENYKKYRKGGRFDVVIENIKKLVDARKKLNSLTPFISWQFLIFEHNKHEIDLAVKMGEELGIDELNLGTPFDVSAYDPEIIIPPEAAQLSKRIHYPASRLFFNRALNDEQLKTPHKNIKFKSWIEQYEESGCDEFPDTINKGYMCDWLYQGIVIDANGRVLPCCSAPSEGRNLVFSNISKAEKMNDDIYNSEMFLLAREGFIDNNIYKRKIEKLDANKIPYCEECGGNNGSVNVSTRHVMNCLFEAELFFLLTKENKIELTKWQ